MVLAHLAFTWIWISSESSLARPCSCPALGSRALTTTRSPVRPFTRPCTVMAKLCCDGSRSDAWDRHQIRFQGEPWRPRTPRRAESVRSPRLFSKAAAFLLWSRPANPEVCRLSAQNEHSLPHAASLCSQVNAKKAGPTHHGWHFYSRTPQSLQCVEVVINQEGC